MRFPRDFIKDLITNPTWVKEVEVILVDAKNSLDLCRLEGFCHIPLPPEILGQEHLLVKGFKVYHPPIKSVSWGSKAVYLASFEDNDATLLVQFLPPWSTTSCHYHLPPAKEAYYLLAGKGYLEIPGYLTYCLEKGSRAVVKPYEVHRYFTREMPALTLLEIIGLSVKDCLYSKRNHIYVTSNI